MNQGSILPLLGPFVVLYTLADAASARHGLAGADWIIGGVAFVSSLAPVWLRGLVRAEQPGARRTGTLGLAAGVALAAALAPPATSLSADVLSSLAVPAVGALTLDLALTVPRGPDGYRRLRPFVPPLWATAALLGCLAVLPAFELFGQLVLAPSSRFVLAPHLFAMGAAGLALVLRLLHRPLGSGPEALAANAWAVMGLVPAVLAYGVALSLAEAPESEGWMHGLAASAAAALVYGHSTLVNPKLRLSAGSSVRRALAGAITLLVVAACAFEVASHFPGDPAAQAVAAAALVVLAVGLDRVLGPAVRWLLAPAGGRLIDAVSAAIDGLAEATDLAEMGRAVLPPLRAASADREGEALLYTVDPPLEVRIDAAGQPHVREAGLPTALAACLADQPGELVVRSALEDKVVRRPDLRALVEVLVAYDALCAVPLTLEGELEGAVLVPRGRRRTTLSLEELAALESLGQRLAATVSVLTAARRAQLRAGALTLEHERAEEKNEALEEEVARLRADLRVLRSGRAAGPTGPVSVAYSPAMRAFERRLAEVAVTEAPVLLVAEGGSAVEQIARRLHRSSPRADGPFVVGDCVSPAPERLAAALFGSIGGDDPHPGWLRLAAGGTLLLTDVAALGPEAARQLAEALAVRQARAVDGPGSYPLEARIVATSRVPLPALVALGLFDAELEKWLSPLRLVVPPLRQRRQDIPSLILLALDRACRVLGKEPMGIEQGAVDALLGYEFPGNLRELENVIERAVRRSSGSQVTRRDLPPVATPSAEAPEAVSDPLEGTYTELEKRILERALERAGGNKSEAARLLGLKRTTFLDKLRRHDLDGPVGSSSEDAA